MLNLKTDIVPDWGELSLVGYARAAKSFADDTRDWYGLQSVCCYTTCGGDWRETSDNAHGGLDLAWAFHATHEEIDAQAAQHYLRLLAIEAECIED